MAIATDQEWAVAEAWASIDGKLKQFQSDYPGSGAGYMDGYLTEARELVQRVERRGFKFIRKGKR